jgi:Ca2+-binding EF-hand superfamily protein
LKTVLDFQLREHEKFLSRFTQEFRGVDTNNDGVIDEAQFRTLMKRLKVIPQNLTERFLQDIDPFNNQKVSAYMV